MFADYVKSLFLSRQKRGRLTIHLIQHVPMELRRKRYDLKKKLICGIILRQWFLNLYYLTNPWLFELADKAWFDK